MNLVSLLRGCFGAVAGENLLAHFIWTIVTNAMRADDPAKRSTQPWLTGVRGSPAGDAGLIALGKIEIADRLSLDAWLPVPRLFAVALLLLA